MKYQVQTLIVVLATLIILILIALFIFKVYWNMNTLIGFR